VRHVEGPEVWKPGLFDRPLLDAALARCETRNRLKGKLEDVDKRPALYLLEYRDGFRAGVLVQSFMGEWAAAWCEKGRAEPQATLFWMQDERPIGNFTFFVQGIERMIVTGKPTWPVERTLLMTGVLDALAISKEKKGARVETPHLAIAYKPTWSWKEPPPPPPGRPYTEP
jgi:hypothetical protein